MVTSADGKATGEFLWRPECSAATAAYYEINRKYMSYGADGFICGRITMQGSFTGGYYPDLTAYSSDRCAPVSNKIWLGREPLGGFYAVAFDPRGRLGWRSSHICDPDGDPGYDGARIIEVLTEQTDARYLAYLEDTDIPYIVAGGEYIDVPCALAALREHFGIKRLLLEGGSVINGHFLRAGCVDELSLVQSPIIADREDKPLFDSATPEAFTLAACEVYDGAVWLNYKKSN